MHLNAMNDVRRFIVSHETYLTWRLNHRCYKKCAITEVTNTDGCDIFSYCWCGQMDGW